MKLIFLNIWNCTREEEAIDFIKSNVADTDVFCLQEVYEKTQELLRSVLSDYEYIADYKTLSTDEVFPQATYVKKSLTVLSHESILKEKQDAGLAIHTKVKINNKIVNICNIHGVFEPVEKLDTEGRLNQSRDLINFYKNLPEPTIIGGDFNLNENSQSVKCFEESGYRNLIKEFSITTTRNRFVWELYPETIQYYSDYVFISKNLAVKTFEVPENEISDHLPMILEINL